MNSHVEARLSRLTQDQRAAATAPSGPILCVAPAGSGKTTTLVARAAWLIDGGTPPDAIRAISFNKRAAEELTERLDAALEPLGVVVGSVAVRTFHALGREILRDAHVPVEPLADRDAILRRVRPDADAAERMRLDTAISRLKLELGVTAAQVANDPDAGPTARAFVDYERAVASTGGLDFDDLVVRAIDVLSTDESLLTRWRGRCRELLVDEVQDVDRAQLRLALQLAAPANRIFLVGDDDQSIYGWRLADVRRVLGLAALLPGLRRVDLEVNHRCPPPIVERAVRLVEHNRERFAKRIRAGTRATGSLVLAPDGGEETVRLRRALESWPDDGSTRAVLARTNRELLPAVAVALQLGWPFRAPRIELPVESPLVDEALDLIAEAGGGDPPLVAVARARSEAADAGRHDLAAALRDLLGWAAPFGTPVALANAVRDTRSRLGELRQEDAPFSLATAHATKGLEFDHVVVIGMEEGRFPSARSVQDAADPARALEEERRLAYVAWTRARRTLTLLYDPLVPSPFLLEAFDPDELGLPAARPAA
jgi:superfamily I DNA/RNA helicase